MRAGGWTTEQLVQPVGNPLLDARDKELCLLIRRGPVETEHVRQPSLQESIHPSGDLHTEGWQGRDGRMGSRTSGGEVARQHRRVPRVVQVGSTDEQGHRRRHGNHNRTKETITIPHQQRGPISIEPGGTLEGPFIYTYDPDNEGAIRRQTRRGSSTRSTNSSGERSRS